MRNKKKTYIVVALIILLLVLAVGYSAFGGSLNIVGTAKTNSFDVEFTDASGGDVAGVISNAGQTVTVSNVVLDHPGDYKTIVAKVENLGSIGATIESFNIVKTGVQSDQDAIDITVTPTSSVTLDAGDSELVTITVTWNAATSSNLSSTVGFTLTANYTQSLT